MEFFLNSYIILCFVFGIISIIIAFWAHHETIRLLKEGKTHKNTNTISSYYIIDNLDQEYQTFFTDTDNEELVKAIEKHPSKPWQSPPETDDETSLSNNND